LVASQSAQLWAEQQDRAEAAVRALPQPLEVADAVVRRADAGKPAARQELDRIGDRRAE
jgi:hypothetical protein